MKVRDYLPHIYDSNLEMQALTRSEENEFEENLKPAIDNSFKDEFVVTATENGIENFEKILSIIPNTQTEDLDLRRARVLNRLISQIPFTENYLKHRLDEIIGIRSMGLHNKL